MLTGLASVEQQQCITVHRPPGCGPEISPNEFGIFPNQTKSITYAKTHPKTLMPQAKLAAVKGIATCGEPQDP